MGPPHSLSSIVLRARCKNLFLNAVYLLPLLVTDPSTDPTDPGRIRTHAALQILGFHHQVRRIHRRIRRIQKAKTLHWLCNLKRAQVVHYVFEYEMQKH